jgi:diguanylate cyclase (GGDEF)-like protein/PAS domain S-box-containing protein
MNSLSGNPCLSEQDQAGKQQAFIASLARVLLDTAFEGVYTVDRERRITYWSSGAEALTGYAASEAVGRFCDVDFLMDQDESECLMCIGNCPFTPALKSGRRVERETSMLHKDGRRVTVSIRVAPLYDDKGEIVAAVQVLSDLSRVKAIERRAVELEQLAFRDFLTALPNRRYTDHKIQQAIEDCNHFGRSYGLLMIDLDNFKHINDAHGHLAGDALLQSIAKNLALGLRSNDMVGRWGGEEFVVIAADASPRILADLAERCRAIIACCAIQWEGTPLSVTGCVGATLIRQQETAFAAVERADALMYMGKKQGGNLVTFENAPLAPPQNS